VDRALILPLPVFSSVTVEGSTSSLNILLSLERSHANGATEDEQRLGGINTASERRVIFNSDGFSSLPPSFLILSSSSHPVPPAFSLSFVNHALLGFELSRGSKERFPLSLFPCPHSLLFPPTPSDLSLPPLLAAMTRLFALLPLLSLALAMPTPGASSSPPFSPRARSLTTPTLSPIAGYDDDKSSGVDVNIEKNLKVKDKEVEVALKEVRLSFPRFLNLSAHPFLSTTGLLP
jgi:hypothetical protein